ncbi:MAG: hypothetical protein V3U76_16405 [Granulosicoccus sp.]
MRYCTGTHENGKTYDLQDPRHIEIAQKLSATSSIAAMNIYTALESLPDLFPVQLREHEGWVSLVTTYLDMMMGQGMQSAIERVVRETV